MSVKKNIFYNVMLNILQLLFPIISAPYIARVLGVENIGLVNFAGSYIGYFVLFASLGIRTYGMREIAKYRNNAEKTFQIFSGIFRINIITTLIASTVFCASIFFVPELRKDWLVFILCGISLYLTPLSIDWYFQGLENFKIITIRSLIMKSISFAGLFIFVREREDIVPYILLSVFATVASNIWNLIYAKKQGLKIRWRKINAKMHLRPLLVFFIGNVANSIFTMLNVIMLGFLSSYEQVGFFTSSNKIMSMATTIFAAINLALFPRLTFGYQQKSNSNKELLQKNLDMTLLLIMPMAAGLCLIAPRFIPLFFGEGFTGSIVPMQIMSFKIIASVISALLWSNILIVMGHETKSVFLVILTSIAAIVLNWILIPKYSAVGASIASVIIESFQLVLVIIYVRILTNVRLNWKKIISGTVFIVPFFGLYKICNNFIANNMIFLLCFIVLSASLYFILQLFVAKNYLIIQTINLLKKKIK
jgi:O-antigen/teichoic acid export membrane protein